MDRRRGINIFSYYLSRKAKKQPFEKNSTVNKLGGNTYESVESRNCAESEHAEWEESKHGLEEPTSNAGSPCWQ